MGDGPLAIALLLSLLAASAATAAKTTLKKGNKFYRTEQIPMMKWNWELDGAPPPYKHEIVIRGGLTSDIKEGSNFSVHPDKYCAQRISFVVQLDPPEEISKEIEARMRLTCTVSITIDDGHVEVWYGLCLTGNESKQRKFDFPLPPMGVVYFNFDKFTMRVYRKNGDFEQDFEMGRIEFISADKAYSEFKKFQTFLLEDSCPHVSLKEVYVDGHWRQLKTSKTGSSSARKPDQLWTLVAIFSFFFSIGCLILSTMYVWSLNVNFPTNCIYDVILSRYKQKQTKGGMAVAVKETKEPNSCKTAEDAEEDEFNAGQKEDLFGEKGRNRAPMRCPAGWALPDYDAPYEDDPEEGAVF